MRIIVALLDSDTNYTNRLMMKFADSYSDKLELHSFSDEKMALDFVTNSRVHVLLANYACSIDPSKIPQRCGFAYLVDSMDISKFKEEKAVCKYQKADLIYKEILSIFYEKVPGGLQIRVSSNDGTQIMAFMPCAGGVGSSTAAVACSKYLASQGKRVLYLNAERFGDPDLFFRGEGSSSLSDVITALKQKKSNLALKIESAQRMDVSGVSYFASAKYALDVLEFSGEDLETLCANALKFDYIIIDSDFGVTGLQERIMRIANRIILCSDGSEIANAKLRRIADTLAIIENQRDNDIMTKLYLLYNRFNEKMGKTNDGGIAPALGAIMLVNGAPCEYVVNTIVASGVFSCLM